MSKTPTPLTMDRRLARVADAQAALTDALDGFLNRLNKLTAADACPQSALSAVLKMKEMKDTLEETIKAFDARVAEHKHAGGAFETGRIAINISPQSRRTVPWQDVAVDLAIQLATYNKVAFNKDTFIESTKVTRGKVSEFNVIKLTVSD